MFGTKGGERTGNGEDYVTRSFVIGIAQQILLGR